MASQESLNKFKKEQEMCQNLTKIFKKYILMYVMGSAEALSYLCLIL